MKRNVIYIMGVFLLTMAVMSCKRPNPTLPEICPPNDFTLLEPFEINNSTTTQSLDFTSSAASFTAVFNYDANWTVKLTGSSSGVTKTFTGTSDTVDVQWRGEPGTNFFEVEEVTATLTVECLGEQGSVKGNITKTSDWSTFTNGLIGSDFDGNTDGASPTTSFGATLADSSEFVSSGRVSPSPQGGDYFNMRGYADNATWYFGGAQIASLAFGSLPTSDPEEIYVNLYVNANNATNSQAQITLSGGGTSKTYFYTATGGDWNLVSFSLADIGISDVSGLNAIDFAMGAAPEATAEAELNFDFFVVTTGGPLFEK